MSEERRFNLTDREREGKLRDAFERVCCELEEARAEVERLRKELALADDETLGAIRERDTLRAEVERLKKS